MSSSRGSASAESAATGTEEYQKLIDELRSALAAERARGGRLEEALTRVVAELRTAAKAQRTLVDELMKRADDQSRADRAHSRVPDRVVSWVETYCVPVGTPVTVFVAALDQTHDQLARVWRLVNAVGREVVRGDLVGDNPIAVQTSFDGPPAQVGVELDTSGLEPGFYEVRFDVDQRDGEAVSRIDNAASCWFGVRNSEASPDDIALLVPSFTLQAYNPTDGKSFYRPHPRDQKGVRRIGGSRPFSRRHHDRLDHHSFVPAVAFEHLVRDLGYTPAPVDSTWVHESTVDQMIPYSQLVVCAHDEYLTSVQRANLAEYVARGGRLTIACGNFCWWKIHVEDDGDLSVCKVVPDEDELTDKRGVWGEPGVGADPSSDFGLTFRHGGYPLKLYAEDVELDLPRDDLERSGGMRVFDGGHPIFADTGLATGDWFGVAEEIVDVEIDGIQIDDDGAVVNERGSACPDRARPLATARLVRLLGGKQVIESATMVELLNDNHGRVVHLGSCMWFRAEQFRELAAFQVLANTIGYQMNRTDTHDN